MRLTFAAIVAAQALLVAPSLAQDIEAGAKSFNKCQTCHVVAAPDGTVLAGKAAKTGPNLYGVAGRVAGTYPEFAYGESIVALGATGFTWNEADFVTYLADPTKFLKTKLDDTGARSKMAFKITKEDEAKNLWAYITSLAPATEAAPAAGAAPAPATN